VKTEKVEIRQKEQEHKQRLKREKIAMGNSTMQARRSHISNINQCADFTKKQCSK
jgi:hypothetical protein